uniref:Uncharacterized protein n=1 Tax=Arundo donax TaxID=35708 RepID=A0A0A8Z2D3_ARUDO
MGTEYCSKAVCYVLTKNTQVVCPSYVINQPQ